MAFSDGHANAKNLTRQRREKKLMTAQINAENRAKRSPAQQLAELDARLGKGMGATKERARLAAMMAEAATPKKEKKEKKDK